ncbi:MAG: DUF2505 domain-containing protein [Actinomycetota bacterium]
MKFELSHAFDPDPQVVARALLDPDFQASLKGVGSLKERSVLLQQEETGGRVMRRVRCVLDIDISGPARRFLGDKPPSWIQEEHWDPATARWDWVIQPEVARELLSASGHTVLSNDGGGTLRTVVGDVRVHVPIYGGRVEKWLVEGITRAYDEEAERLRMWMRR